ncbi:hypothetical protein ML695_17045, partial [Yersinia pestis]|nr:hypothetical protein [Yersinia pestis]MCU7451197.1 hypothetical protein [Yersinia pestis]MCU7455229.1 hypothetical protein [Yersinia pestis]MCU7459308.1 hypothetical protein [Yersinia pestis]MCU7463345.1 hypothetical protein [Yersinia pestis]
PAEWPFLKGNVEPPLGGLKKGVSLNRTSRSWIKRSKIWGSVQSVAPLEPRAFALSLAHCVGSLDSSFR